MSAERIGELEGMTVKELRIKYAEVYGEPTSSANRQWLLRRVAWRMQVNAEGDLSERARRRAAELARDADVRVRPPADAGDVSTSTAPGRRASSPRVYTVTGRIVPKGDRRLPPPGTELRRTHGGVEHRVLVLPEGFEHEGVRYRSLSAVARAITGAHWNGFLFFGLTRQETP